MLLHFCEEHVDVVAAVLLPVLKDGLALIKEQQSIVDLCLPACPGNTLFADLYQRGSMSLHVLPGCPMNHNWLHTPDCKVRDLNENHRDEHRH